jgi:putative aldouronate transport system permease protein
LIITPKSLTMAAVVVATGPIILVYPWIQKYFMKGIRLGSIKG